MRCKIKCKPILKWVWEEVPLLEDTTLRLAKRVTYCTRSLEDQGFMRVVGDFWSPRIVCECRCDPRHDGSIGHWPKATADTRSWDSAWNI